MMELVANVPPHSQHLIQSSRVGDAYIFKVPDEAGGLERLKGPHDETVTLWKGAATREWERLTDTGDYDLEVGAVAGLLTELHSLRGTVTSRDLALYDHVKGTVENCLYSNDPSLVASELRECLSLGVYEKIQDELSLQTELNSLQVTMAKKLRDYTCRDHHLDTSPSLSTRTEYVHDRVVTVNTLLHQSHANIWTVDDMVSPRECAALMAQVETRLQRAVTLGGVHSDSRRARQAGYVLQGGERDPVWNLYQRILNFTNAHSTYDLRADGQEHLTVIQYAKGDEYL